MNNEILFCKDRMPLLGFTVSENPEPVYMKPHHTLISGMTREAGKTTAAEGLLSRWEGKRVLAFKAKRGEESFKNSRQVKPFYKQQSGWQYVESIIESALQERQRILRSTIMTVCTGTKTLDDVWNNVKETLAKLGDKDSFTKSMLVQLDEYLKIVVPQIKQFQFADKLELQKGINVMDLSGFTVEMQGMIIGACAEYILDYLGDVVLVIPEGWEILPSGKGSPAKSQVEALIRKGAVLGNFVLIDSQDIVGIHPPIRKQMGNMLLGKQQDIVEVERTLDAIPLPNSAKPKADEIQTLKLGQFFAVTDGRVAKIFAMPAWMDTATAIECAKNPDLAATLKPTANSIVQAEAPVLGELPEMQSVESEPTPTPSGGPLDSLQAWIIEIVNAELERNEKRKKPIESSMVAGSVDAQLLDITVTERIVENPNFDDSTLEGQLLILIAEGKFANEFDLRAVMNLIWNTFGGDRNTSRFTERLLPVLAKLSTRPFAFLVREGDSWKEAPDAKKRLHKRVQITSA